MDIKEGDPSSLEKGRRFTRKLITQWLDTAVDDQDDIVFCDGSGDGGIDIALLVRATDASEGDTWYLVQGKYGSALQGPNTIMVEGRKVVETLQGHRNKLSSLASGLRERLTLFREQMSTQDRLVLVLATERTLSDAERRTENDVRAFGRDRLGNQFDVAELSVDNDLQPPSVGPGGRDQGTHCW